MFGADLDITNWDDFRFFGETDEVQNSWKVNVGGQIIPKAREKLFKLCGISGWVYSMVRII